MLRRSKNTSTDSNVDMKKRQSMFLGSKTSATSLSSDFANSHSKTKQKKQESSSSLFSSLTHKNRSNLKRSSMLLDETVLKDYHSAIKHMQMDNAKEEKLRFAPSPTQSTRSESDASLSSSKSAMSSIFSLENDYSIHDLLYEEIEEMDKETDGPKVNNTIAMDESKALFVFCSNESSLRMASNETLHELMWDTPDVGSDRRTSLNFF
ncbi:YBR071W [Saccharomyces arboricola H-6]|uniref:YBR071W n=1 Tax=Saccharomyces arboricola (strain H-6 / AS 2.3317 / CBS 10644) TaxID=1160507 RepID=J8LRM1_SACAR|nr:YBR071W [Saccharomyces arboricola H-6]